MLPIFKCATLKFGNWLGDRQKLIIVLGIQIMRKCTGGYSISYELLMLFQTLQEALELKSKLERVNEQLQIKFQSDLEDLIHLTDE